MDPFNNHCCERNQGIISPEELPTNMATEHPRPVNYMIQTCSSNDLDETRFMRKIDEASNMTDIVFRVKESIGILANQLHANFGKDGTNTCFSPLSIFPVLCMVADGMPETERNLFLQSMGLQDVGMERVREALKVISASFTQDKSNGKFTLKTAQGMAVVEAKEAFVNKMRNGYDAEVFPCSGDPQKACDQVNGWVEEKTDGQIPTLLSPDDIGDDDLAAILLNAVYFNGSWKNAFVKDLTEPKPFYFSDGSSKLVESMQMEESESFRYYKSSNVSYSMLEMPFKTSYGQELVCLIYLPNSRETEDLRAIENSLNLKKITEDRSQAGYYDIDLQLPKMEINNKIDQLLDSLVSTAPHQVKGVCEEVSLPEIGPKTRLSKVVHQAKLKFDENGAEGAAATAAICTNECNMVCFSKPTPFIVDHPFAFVLMHNDTIIFQGSIKDASALSVKE